MKRFLFNKLVRDNILDGMNKDESEHPHFRVLEDEEFFQELVKKIIEESDELLKCSSLDRAEELADIYEVLAALMKLLKVSEADLLKIIEKKKTSAGGFDKRVFIEYNEVDDDSKWVDEYRKQPHKYQEVE